MKKDLPQLLQQDRTEPQFQEPQRPCAMLTTRVTSERLSWCPF